MTTHIVFENAGEIDPLLMEAPAVDDANITVSPQMVSDGLRVYDALKDSFPDYLLVAEVYKAMRLAACRQCSRDAVETGQNAAPNACLPMLDARLSTSSVSQN